MSLESKEFVVAKDYDQLVTLFYSDLYFKALELAKDEEIAKGMTKKIFEVARKKFNERNNNLQFLESLLVRFTTYQKRNTSAPRDGKPETDVDLG